MKIRDEALAKACCADLYHSDLARLVLGDTLHPGGLALTHRLGRLMDIRPGDLVADLASGRGVSAMAVSRAFHCRVAGVEFSRGAAGEARAAAFTAPIISETFFLQGDAEYLPLATSCCDAVLSECSVSIFPDKARAIKEAVRILRPGGSLGLSDVTVEPGSLPTELEGTVGRLFCLADALNAAGYAGLLESGGLTVRYQEDASSEILKLLEDLEGKLGAWLAWQRFAGSDAVDSELLAAAPGLIAKLKKLVQSGKLGYWLYVAQKPA